VLTADTRLVALLGHPVAHSLSPRMQNAAFAARGLDWAYVALDVQPERLGQAVRGLAAAGFAGANVTAPHKLAVVALSASSTTGSRAGHRTLRSSTSSTTFGGRPSSATAVPRPRSRTHSGSETSTSGSSRGAGSGRRTFARQTS
jgi:Shikimate dehydrogenase substrate binding domain